MNLEAKIKTQADQMSYLKEGKKKPEQTYIILNNSFSLDN